MSGINEEIIYVDDLNLLINFNLILYLININMIKMNIY